MAIGDLDFTKLSNAAGRKVYYEDNCEVLDIGSGAFPREIEVRVPGDDGARLTVTNNNLINLTTSDTVLISIDNTKEVARVVDFGSDTAGGNQGVSNLYVEDDIIHVGDADTLISFTDDAIALFAGNVQMLTLTEAATDEVVVNEGGNDVNFRVEGLTNTEMLFVDAGNDRVGVNEAAPDHTLHVTGEGAGAGTVFLLENASAVRFDMIDQNSTSGNRRFAFAINNDIFNISQRTDTGGFTQTYLAFNASTTVAFISAGVQFSVGTGTPSSDAKVHLRNESTTSGYAVVMLEQEDVSEEFIRYRGTAASAVLTQSIVDNGDVTTATLQGWVKVFVEDDGNQITDQAYFQPLYTLA